MKTAESTDQHVDLSTDVKGYKQALDNLNACISACDGADLLSEAADVAVAARELEDKMQAKLRDTIKKSEKRLLGSITQAETTRKPAPLSANLETLTADEVLCQSCGDTVTRAKKLLVTLRAEEKERIAAVSACKISCNCFVSSTSKGFVSVMATMHRSC